MNQVLVIRLGDQSLPRERVVSLAARPDMALAYYRVRKTTTTIHLKFRFNMEEFSFQKLVDKGVK